MSEGSFYGSRVPRVSASHRTARREQILDAALTRFAENGFQATGMADIIAASGLSAGAVYRYFASKDELIAAIVDRVLSQTVARFEDLLEDGAAPTPADAVRVAVETVERVATSGPVDVTRVAVQAWAEALRSPGVHAIATNAYTTIRGYFVEVVQRSQAAGVLPRSADPGDVGAALFSLVLGFLLQRALLGDVEARSYVRAVTSTLLPAGDSRAPTAASNSPASSHDTRPATGATAPAPSKPETERTAETSAPGGSA